jgi:ubiquinone/menaquinone biosynthesis C-methylase UbiE
VKYHEFDKYSKNGAYHWENYWGDFTKINSFVRGRYKLVLDILKEHKIANKTVLDLGCGDGALAGLLAMEGAIVTGIDLEPKAIELAREMFSKRGLNGNFILQQTSTAQIIANTSFDYIVCADVIEHVEKPDIMLEEIHRILKPGGMAILTTPVRLTEIPQDKYHVREWYPNEFFEFCSSNKSKFNVLKQDLSHPVIWYEIYTTRKNLILKIICLIINVLDKFGFNVFINASFKIGKCMSMQTIVLRK